MNVNKIFSYSFILLLTSGIGNAVFGNTVLAGWKQLILTICYALCFSIANRHVYLGRLFVISLLIQIALILVSVISGVEIKIVGYNLYYYSAWIPFFIWAARGGADYFLMRYDRLLLYLVLICSLGLVIDYKSDIFLFLASRSDELDTEYFVKNYETVKRSAFIFTTSTLVMPVLGGIIVMSLLKHQTEMRVMVCGLAIVIGIITSATANSVVAGSIIFVGVLLQLGVRPVQFLGTLLLFVSAFLVIIPLVGESEAILFQLRSVVERQYLDSEGNIGRYLHWNQAIADILNFNILEHIAGSGLGTSNGNNGNQMVLHTHGESSFFQSYLEGGILGTLLRVAPFVMALTYTRKDVRSKYPFVILSYILAMFIVTAVAPIFGNIPSQALLGFLIGHMYANRKRMLYSSGQVFA